MPDHRGSVREIVWQEIFPWLLLVRSFRASIQIGQLALASAGVLATVFGWWLLAVVFGGTTEAPLKDWIGSYRTCPWSAAVVINTPEGRISVTPQAPAAETLLPLGEARRGGPPQLGAYPANPFIGAWQQLRAPFQSLFERDLGITGLAFLLLACLWASAVWALFGGAITRRAALQLGREENVGLRDALGFARSKWMSYFAAPLLPLLGVALAASPVWLLGLIMRLDVGVLLAGIVWPLALLAGLLMALLLLAMLFGWPLMWPAISSEGTDSFDALSRAWSYVFHRPLHYLFYAAVTAFLGGLGWLFVEKFAEIIIYLPRWAASWGAGAERFAELQAVGQDGPGAMARWGGSLIGFWSGCVRLIALGFAYSYFWTAATAIYLLLRRDDDGMEIDELHVEAPRETYGLPPLEKDAAGVTVVAPEGDAPAAPAAPASESSSGGEDGENRGEG